MWDNKYINNEKLVIWYWLLLPSLKC